MKKVGSYKLRKRKVYIALLRLRSIYRCSFSKASRFVVFTNSRNKMHLPMYRIDLQQEDAQTYWNIDITLCRSIFTVDLSKMTSKSKYGSSYRCRKEVSLCIKKISTEDRTSIFWNTYCLRLFGEIKHNFAENWKVRIEIFHIKFHQKTLLFPWQQLKN